MKPYDPKDWYWYVAGDLTKVYSSKAAAYVPANDATFVAWVASGGVATNIDTEENLGDVLAAYYPDVPRPNIAGIVSGYQQSQADDVFKHKFVKVLFVLLNRIQVLESKPQLTVAQARAYVRGLM